MRYVDTGSRNPKQALGSWLSDELQGSDAVVAMRVQTGFFGSDALGYFEDALDALEQSDGHTRFLIGSNDGLTPRAAISDLLKVCGQPRGELRVGVVSFQAGFFHPKVFHFERADGSSTAYVGSANLTRSGATSLHVEAGIILDSKQGDPQSVLKSVADAVDGWFTQSRAGLYEVSSEADLDSLVVADVLGVPVPSRVRRTVKATKSAGSAVSAGVSLKPLVAAPGLKTPLPKPQGTPAPSPIGGAGTSTSQPPMSQPAAPQPPTAAASVKHWGKVLPASDAQRKLSGNQSGAVALTQGDYRNRIDQTVYFRNDLFASRTWVKGTANTGQPVEWTTVPMHVTIRGAYHGVLDFKVTNASNRESSQNNYTAQLHLEPIRPIFAQANMTNRHLEIALDSNRDYWLTIS